MAKTSNRFGIFLAVAVLIAIAAAVWLHKRSAPPPAAPASADASDNADAVIAVSSDQIDASKEGRTVAIAGALQVKSPARDPATGIGADNAVLLLRYVEMLQWREQCSGKSCNYKTVWATYPVDSRKFREPGHENPRMPMTSARFAASDVKLGAFAVDAYRAASGDRAVPFPVKTSDLAPNIAMTFRDVGGTLYGGNDPTKPAVGDLRVSYRIVRADTVHLTGVQRGERLIVQKMASPQQ